MNGPVIIEIGAIADKWTAGNRPPCRSGRVAEELCAFPTSVPWPPAGA